MLLKSHNDLQNFINGNRQGNMGLKELFEHLDKHSGNIDDATAKLPDPDDYEDAKEYQEAMVEWKGEHTIS